MSNEIEQKTDLIGKVISLYKYLSDNIPGIDERRKPGNSVAIAALSKVYSNAIYCLEGFFPELRLIPEQKIERLSLLNHEEVLQRLRDFLSHVQQQADSSDKQGEIKRQERGDSGLAYAFVDTFYSKSSASYYNIGLYLKNNFPEL